MEILGRVLGDARGMRILELISVFHHLPIVSAKPLCALAHLGCTRKVDTS